MRFLIIALFLLVCASNAFSQPKWLERCELSGDPYRIRLARLYFLLNGIREEQPRQIVPQETVSSAGEEFGLPDDVLFYILRAEEFSLQDAACLRLVSRRFCNVAGRAFRGQIAFEVQNTVDLVRLMALDGSPLLPFIGTLVFAFNQNAITSPVLGAFGRDWEARLCHLASASKRPFQYLLSGVLLDFRGFVERNLPRFDHVHTIMFERGLSPWDYVIVDSMFGHIVDRRYFPRLRALSLCSQPTDAMDRMTLCFQLIIGIHNKHFSSIILDTLNAQEFALLLSEIDCARLSSVQTLAFFDVNCGERLFGDFARMIGDGRLPNLRDIALVPYHNAVPVPTAFYDAVANVAGLRWLALTTARAFAQILRHADNGSFQNLESLDLACAEPDLNAQVAVSGLTRRLPALRRIWLPCSHIPSNFVFTLIRNPRYAALLEFVDFDALCERFHCGEETAELENAQQENPYLPLLRQIAEFPEASRRQNPHLDQMAQGARVLDRFDSTHLYTESDVHWLLWLSLGAEVNLLAPHDPLIRDNSVLFPPLALAFGDEAIELETFLKNYLAEHQTPARLLVPLNYGDHWMGLLIDFAFDAQGQVQVDIWLLDSLDEALDRELVLTIRNIVKRVFRQFFPEALFHFERVVPRVQPTRYDCGVALVENLVELFGVNAAPRQHHMTLHNALQLRGHHFRLLRDHGETFTEQIAFRPSQLATSLLVGILAYVQFSARR